MIDRLLKPSLILAALACLTVSPAAAQGTDSQAALPKPTAMKVGGLLSGELTAMRSKARGKGKKGPVYQLVSEPRRLPPPAGLCNLENGPETFQIVPASDSQAAQLKSHLGKQVSLKVEAVACAEEAGQYSEAVVTKWSLAN
ncbi:hypothetical protein LPW26_04610 [Rhodopseudomonas sp. HC1]|uniref:hypothetical protein n=1 Tax=Rhodopseudomonas infernalis TaxID=2897386 RepID=UPI001EE8BD85|nr:hypothetical protein [Rhodopseudomonas infernalis]MCG6203906.1 hypothetical protein [Rhodopseudomonas infernalis]